MTYKAVDLISALHAKIRTRLIAGAAIVALLIAGMSFPSTAAHAATAPRCVSSPRVNSTLIAPFPHIVNWTNSQWVTELNDLADACVTEVVLTASAQPYDGVNRSTAYYASPNSRFTSSRDVVGALLRAARSITRVKFKVYLGLQEFPTSGWWGGLTWDTDWSSNQIATSKAVANDLWSKYGPGGSVGDFSSVFAGWYLTPELEDDHFADDQSRTQVKRYFQQVTSSTEITRTARPVLTAPAFKSVRESERARWKGMITALAEWGVDVIAVQDRTAEEFTWRPSTPSSPYGQRSIDLTAMYTAAAEAIAAADPPGNEVELWADLELYRFAEPDPWTVTPKELVEQQIAPIAACGCVTKFLSVSFTHYYGPQSGGTPYYTQYKRWVSTGSFVPASWVKAPVVTVNLNGLAAEITWTEGFTGTSTVFTSYQLWRVTDAGWVKIATRRNMPWIGTDENLAPGVRHTYVVEMYDTAGNTLVAQATPVTPEVPRGSTNLVAGRTYSASTTAYDGNKDTSGMELTDGIRGSAAYNPFEAPWQGRVQSNYSFTFDLGETKQVSYLTSRWLRHYSACVYLPDSVTYETAVAGQPFTLYSRGGPGDYGGYGDIAVDYRAAGKTVDARYIRVTVTTPGCVSMVDEVEVYGPYTSVSAPTYRTTPTSSSSFPDSTVRPKLTDGVRASPGPWDTAWVGWATSTVVITMTLPEGVSTISGVSVGALSWDTWGIRRPDTMTVRLSRDGGQTFSTWDSVQASGQPVNGASTLAVSEPSTTANVVEIRLTGASGWNIFLDEVVLTR